MKLLAGLAIVALAVLLVGCGDGSSDSTAKSPPPGAPGSELPAPGVPTGKGGNNSIQTWGVEATRAERAAATVAVREYLNARADGRWADACALLETQRQGEYRRLGAGATCAATMGNLASEASAAALAEEARIHPLSLRVGKGHAFLIYRRPDGNAYAMPLKREDGEWRLGLVTPAQLE